MSSGIFCLISLDRSISYIRGVLLVFIITMCENPDQTSLSVASDLSLHCLPMSLLWDARLKWVKMHICFSCM